MAREERIGQVRFYQVEVWYVAVAERSKLWKWKGSIHLEEHEYQDQREVEHQVVEKKN
jgi:hypothetical protein